MRLNIYIFLACIILVSCQSQKRIQREAQEQTETTERAKAAMNSWMGHPEYELIQSWGSPTRRDSDGQGGEILIYEDTRRISIPDIDGTTFGRTFTDYKEMFVNSQKKIYYWRTGRR
ncbi:hypothetical protein BH09BAC2_BH09BAC2_05330 [soil metagenome]